MNKNMIRGLAATLLVAGAAIVPSQAATVFVLGRLRAVGHALNTGLPTGWMRPSGGTVDWIAVPTASRFVATMAAAGCVDLDGTTGDAGLAFARHVHLQSGDDIPVVGVGQRQPAGYGAETVTFGFA